MESQISSVARLVRSIIFYDFPSWVFLCAYVGFTIVVALTMLLIAPRLEGRKRNERETAGVMGHLGSP